MLKITKTISIKWIIGFKIFPAVSNVIFKTILSILPKKSIQLDNIYGTSDFINVTKCEKLTKKFCASWSVNRIGCARRTLEIIVYNFSKKMTTKLPTNVNVNFNYFYCHYCRNFRNY